MNLTSSLQKALSALPPFAKVVVGVSGGADSVALAHTLIKLGHFVHIAHLNHGLRGKESDGDAEFVRNLAKQWNVPCSVEKVEIRRLLKKGENLEDRARHIRYEFLERVRKKSCADCIAVAHHRDDQIETILMHVGRGAGTRGLRGMSLKSGLVIRPFLIIRKQEILDYLEKNKIGYRTDSTNADLRFERNYLRHTLIPKLRKRFPGFEEQLIRASQKAFAESTKKESRANDWIAAHFKNRQFGRADFLKLPNGGQSEVLLTIAGRKDVYRKSVEQALELIREGQSGKEAQLGKTIFTLQYDCVLIGRPQKAVRLKPMILKPKILHWGNWSIRYSGSQKLTVRAWQAGDRMDPSGMKGSKKLQDLFTDLKIPKPERHGMPVIVDAHGRIMGVGNLRYSRHAEGLKNDLEVEQDK